MRFLANTLKKTVKFLGDQWINTVGSEVVLQKAVLSASNKEDDEFAEPMLYGEKYSFNGLFDPIVKKSFSQFGIDSPSEIEIRFPRAVLGKIGNIPIRSRVWTYDGEWEVINYYQDKHKYLGDTQYVLVCQEYQAPITTG